MHIDYYYPYQNNLYHSIIENGERLWIKNPIMFIVLNSMEGIKEDRYIETLKPIDVYRDKDLKDKVAPLEVGSQFEKVAFRVGSAGIFMIKYNDRYYFIDNPNSEDIKKIDSITKTNPPIEKEINTNNETQKDFNYLYLIPVGVVVLFIVLILIIRISKAKKVEVVSTTVVQQPVEQPVQPVVQQPIEQTPVIQPVEFSGEIQENEKKRCLIASFLFYLLL